MEPMDEDTNAPRITSLQERLDHLRQQLASLEEEYARVESELASLQGSQGSDPSGRSSVAVEGQIVTCKHSCAHHKALMDPAVWRNCPGEVLQMVFSRLPLQQIIVSLRCLSREWRRTTQEPGFRRLCASAATESSPSPKMFALVDEASHGMGIVSIRLFDGKSQRWHAFQMALRLEFYYDTMLACDGGLICFVSRMLDKAENPLVIVVLNPLTEEYKVLPPALSGFSERSTTENGTPCDGPWHEMLQSDRGGQEATSHRKVFGKGVQLCYGRMELAAQTLRLISKFGHRFRFDPDGNDRFAADRVGPCVYDCREAELYDLGSPSPSPSLPSLESCTSYALVKDRLFLLEYETRMQRCRPEVGGGYMQLPGLVLSEYQGQKNRPHWMRLRVHECTPLERPESLVTFSEDYHVVLHGCPGSLMVTVVNNEFSAYKLARTWLYDLYTYKWQELPAAPPTPEAEDP